MNSISDTSKFSIINIESSRPENQPYIEIEKTNYELTDIIIVNVFKASGTDWVGFYPEHGEPGVLNSITWQYVQHNTTLQFKASDLGESGIYSVYLCANDGYVVLDKKVINILNSDKTDYKVVSASYGADRDEMGVGIGLVKFYPVSLKKLTYSLYWAKDGFRLDNYTAVKTFTYKASSLDEEVKVFINECLFMPKEANEIEIAIKEGRSSSYFLKANDILKLPKSTYKYSFQVFTDLHIENHTTFPQHISHLKSALLDVQTHSPDSSAIFTVGDHTNHGSEENYKVLKEVIDSVRGKNLPNIYFSLGNHEYIYETDFKKQVDMFLRHTNMPNVYYSVDLEDTKFIVLGSDTIVGEGEILPTQIEWLKNELAKTNKSKPTFLFLHQPLKDTVSGSLYTLKKQRWYGCEVGGEQIREILKDYPNAILFSGHTHWTFDSVQPILFGYGEDASFVNCASVGYLWNDNDTTEPGSEGIFVEVYEDYILIKGREFVEKKWCGVAQFMLPIIK